MTPGRWASVIGLACALYFALQGGEYGTLDLLQLRREEGEERANVVRLQRLVDSLTGRRPRSSGIPGCRSGWRGSDSG